MNNLNLNNIQIVDLFFNPYPLIIPCHRVIRSDGGLGGYSGEGGIKKKEMLLEKENKSLK